MLDKFHAPFGPRGRAICGSTSLIPVMCKVLEKISGLMSTPALHDFSEPVFKSTPSVRLHGRAQNGAGSLAALAEVSSTRYLA